MIFPRKSSFPLLLSLLASIVLSALAQTAMAKEPPAAFPPGWVVTEETDADGDTTWSAHPAEKKNSDEVEIFIMTVGLATDAVDKQAIVQMTMKGFLGELEKASKDLKKLDDNAKFVCEDPKPVQVDSVTGAATACDFNATSADDRFKVELVAAAGEKYLLLTYYMADAPLYQNYLQHWKTMSSGLKVQ